MVHEDERGVLFCVYNGEGRSGVKKVLPCFLGFNRACYMLVEWK